jgi:predicted enzyme related to lactoylglutathione lyase
MEPDTPIIAYAMVDDMDAVLKKVEKHGGKIHRPKMEIPNVGWIAIISDTEGNTIGIWKPGMPPGNH